MAEAPREISVKRAGRVTLEPCSFSLASGERLAVYGPNGAGKSTLLQAAAGLLPIATGGIAFRGINEGYDESTGVLNPQTESLVICGGDSDFDVALGHRPPERLVRERRENLRRAAVLFRGGRGTADENACAAWRGADPRHAALAKRIA